MRFSVGTDIVFIPRFIALVSRTPEIINKVFGPKERIDHLSFESLAGRFAIKESLVKAFDRRISNWHDIIITSKDSGKLEVAFSEDVLCVHPSCDVSVSHDKDYAVAMVVCMWGSDDFSK
jgi:holo-[acyl-carrier protein] synthase